MAFFAYYDSTVADPSPILGWFDTSFSDYPSLPAQDNLIELSDSQWSNRFNGLFASVGGLLTPYNPVYSPSIAQQASAAKSMGLTIISTGTPAVTGTYDCSDARTAYIASLVAYVTAHGAFPAGVSTQPIYDTSGEPHYFPNLATAGNYARAITDYNFALNTIINSNSGTLPANVVTIA